MRCLRHEEIISTHLMFHIKCYKYETEKAEEMILYFKIAVSSQKTSQNLRFDDP